MNPRIFVSSTFYDLKYVREELREFILGFGFDPILSESGNIGYTPWVELDESCYAAMRESDMAVLIIGGRYGSPASNEKDVKTASDKMENFVSITRKEFDTAIKNKVPVFVFIEEGVNTEYRLYKKNKNAIESKTVPLEFEAADHINVFRFIETIRQIPQIAVFTFKRTWDIKDTLKQQWADMFRKYLTSLKQQASTTQEVEPALSQLYSSLQEMNVTLTKIGETVLAEKMEEVTDEQMLENAAGKIAGAFEFSTSFSERMDIQDYLLFFVNQLFQAKRLGILGYPFSESLADIRRFFSFFNYESVYMLGVKEHLEFEDDIFANDSEDFKVRLANRLSKNDYLKKMGFIR